MDTTALVDLAPLGRLLAMASLFALLPLAWVWLRSRGGDARARLATLTALTLFLTFDLIVFGAFTRLSDSGLGCPDWPGCYGAASPLGARDDILAAQTAAPGGPVTWSKAWIEMIHRYLAMTVGALILVMTAASWAAHFAARRAQVQGAAGVADRMPISPWWPTLTLVWVIVQGLFGKYTVTLKLYPAIVTLHLLGGLLLLAMLAVQQQHFSRRALALPRRLRVGAVAVMALLVVQVALGGWVSTNYAVLACTGFPACNGQWWPAMDFGQGFTLLRGLGEAGADGHRGVDALVAIHMAHRLGALVVVTALLALAWALWRRGAASANAGTVGEAGEAGEASEASEAGTRRLALTLALLTALQVGSGLSNVVLGWPLIAALGHSAGAAALVWVLTVLLARSRLSAYQPRAAA